MKPRIKSVLRLVILGGIVAGFCASASTAAAPTLNLTISPVHPYVDDNVRVSFTATRPLEADAEIDVVLFGTGVCSSSLADKEIKGPQSAGHRFSLRFRSSDQIVGGNVEWCQGKAKVRITEARNERFVRKIAQKTIRFRAKP